MSSRKSWSSDPESGCALMLVIAGLALAGVLGVALGFVFRQVCG